MENKKILLSLKNVVVKFHVRGRTLTAIRGVSLDIYENESIAIVGESGSGKSVLTKTFAGMLDSNGYIDSGSIILNDDELQDTVVKKTFFTNKIHSTVLKELNKNSKFYTTKKSFVLSETVPNCGNSMNIIFNVWTKTMKFTNSSVALMMWILTDIFNINH